MKNAPVLRKNIVRFLCTDRLEFLDARETEWMKNLRWLDRSGLALPLAARFEALRPGARVPLAVRAALRSRLRDNQTRMERMLEFFRETVRALDGSHVRYCCVKGFSLVPDCFDSIRERHQIDLDLLIAPQDLRRAQNALEQLGYQVQRAEDSGEVRLVRPWKKHLGVHAYLYQTPEPPAIELHTQVWEQDIDEIEFPSLSGFLDAAEVHEICDVDFTRLRPAYHFVYLLLHIFRHLLGSWTRLLSLYEVATFIRTRSGEDDVWAEAAQIIDRDKVLASACALVLALVDCTFPTDMPPPLGRIGVRSLSAESALWIERHATAWLLADPPGGKLSLLVQRQFWADRGLWRRYLRRRLLPFRKPHPLSDEAMKSTRSGLTYRAEESWYKASRAWYHVRSDFEYLTAWLRWTKPGQARAEASQRIVDQF
jgi:Uncharacterised nucleotidyltransferase